MITFRILREYSLTNSMCFASNYIKVKPGIKKLKNPVYLIHLTFFMEEGKKTSSTSFSLFDTIFSEINGFGSIAVFE